MIFLTIISLLWNRPLQILKKRLFHERTRSKKRKTLWRNSKTGYWYSTTNYFSLYNKDKCAWRVITLGARIISSTPRRTCCEVRVMLCMTQYICAPLQSAGGFILEEDKKPHSRIAYSLCGLSFFHVHVLIYRICSILNSHSSSSASLPGQPQSDCQWFHPDLRS